DSAGRTATAAANRAAERRRARSRSRDGVPGGAGRSARPGQGRAGISERRATSCERRTKGGGLTRRRPFCLPPASCGSVVTSRFFGGETIGMLDELDNKGRVVRSVATGRKDWNR